MQVAEIMTRDLVTVSPADTVAYAAWLMSEHGVSGLPVMEAGRLVGIVTEGDLIHRVENDTDRQRSLWHQVFARPRTLSAEFVKLSGRRVKDVMTHKVATVPETALLTDIAELFDHRRIKRAPVVSNGRMVGIVTRADLIRALVGFGGARAGDMRTVEFT